MRRFVIKGQFDTSSSEIVVRGMFVRNTGQWFYLTLHPTAPKLKLYPVSDVISATMFRRFDQAQDYYNFVIRPVMIVADSHPPLIGLCIQEEEIE
jgi:hypothetical protein